MISHAGDDSEIGDVATRDNEVIVVKLARQTVVTLVLDAVTGQVDAVDLFGPANDVGQKLTERYDHVLQIKGRTNGVGEQWTENKMIFAVKKNDLCIAPSEIGPEGAGTLYAGETAANDNNTFLRHAWTFHASLPSSDCNAPLRRRIVARQVMMRTRLRASQVTTGGVSNEGLQPWVPAVGAVNSSMPICSPSLR